MKKILLLVILSSLISCNNSTEKEQLMQEKKLELEEKSLQLREKELLLKQKENAIDSKYQLSNKSNLFGDWFIPHSATVNICFYENGRFKFNDFNSKKNIEEVLTGEYTLKNGVLILDYDDRAAQKFEFYHGETGDENYYIKKGDYYFVKSE